MGKIWIMDKRDCVKVEFYVPKNWWDFIQEYLEWSGHKTKEERIEEIQQEMSCRFGMWINFSLTDEPMGWHPKKAKYFIEKYDLRPLIGANIFVCVKEDQDEQVSKA